MASHGGLTAAEDIHVLYGWRYADAAARSAATGFVAADVGKVALQADNYSLWMLVDESPITWQQITGTGVGGAVSSVNGETGAVTLTTDDISDSAQSHKWTSAAEITKLAGVEAAADVTDAANVDAAGAVMNSDTSVAGMSFSIDEDSFATNSATKFPTQQSVKAYVDAVASGLIEFKRPVRVATATALASNSRTGDVLTASANGALASIDGISLSVADRLLVKDEATGANNGIYVVTMLGSGGAPWTLTRASDFDVSGETKSGSFMFIEEGSTNADKGFVLSTNNPITLNTTALTFVQFSTVSAYSDEQAQDATAAAFSGGTQTGIAVTYTDGTNTFDFIVDDDWVRAIAVAAIAPGDGLNAVDSFGPDLRTLSVDMAYVNANLDSDLTAIAGLASAGIVARTGSGTAAARTLTGTANEVAIANGDGVSGNPTFSLPTGINPQKLADGSVNATRYQYLANVTGDIQAQLDAVVVGLDFKSSARAATTAALATNARIGNVLTATSSGALAAIDGVTLVANDRLLVKDEAAGANNGIYIVTAVGSGGTPWILTRATDADTSAEVSSGMFLFITEGSVNADKGWVLTTDDPITLNTTSLAFTQFSGTSGYTPGGTDVAIADGGTGASTASAARGNLGLAIGSDVAAPNQDTTGKSAKTDALNSATTVVDVSAAAAPSTGQVMTATDSTHATWQTPAAGANPLLTGLAYQVVKGSGTTLHGFGLTGFTTQNGTASNADGSDGPWIGANSGTATGNTGQIFGGNDDVRGDWLPDLTFVIKTDPTAITNSRYVIGPSNANPSAASLATSHHAVFYYDTDIHGTAFWRVSNNNAGTPTITTTSIAIAADTKYTLRIVFSGSDIKYYINGTLAATHTTTMPTTTIMSHYVRAENRNAVGGAGTNRMVKLKRILQLFAA